MLQVVAVQQAGDVVAAALEGRADALELSCAPGRSFGVPIVTPSARTKRRTRASIAARDQARASAPVTGTSRSRKLLRSAKAACRICGPVRRPSASAAASSPAASSAMPSFACAS